MNSEAPIGGAIIVVPIEGSLMVIGDCNTRGKWDYPIYICLYNKCFRQPSSLHGPYNHSKAHSLGADQSIPNSPAKDGIYGQAPDLPPRVDRAVKPMGLLTTPGIILSE